MLMRHAKRVCRSPSVTLCHVSSGEFLQHECTLAPGRSAAKGRREHSLHVCTSLWVTWSPLLCRLHSAVPRWHSFLWLEQIWDPRVCRVLANCNTELTSKDLYCAQEDRIYMTKNTQNTPVYTVSEWNCRISRYISLLKATGSVFIQVVKSEEVSSSFLSIKYTYKQFLGKSTRPYQK